MAYSANTENNIQSLESIVGSVSVYFDNEPDYIIKINKTKKQNFKEDEERYWIEEYSSKYGMHDIWEFFKENGYVEIYKNRIEVYLKKYHCGFSQQDNVSTYKVSYVYPITENVATTNNHSREGLESLPVPYIHIGTLSKTRELFGFIFNIVDTQNSYYHATQQLQEILPQELVEKIISHFGCDKSKRKYTHDDFPLIVEPHYKGQVPTLLSKYQLRKLYDLGFIKFSFQPHHLIGWHYILNDDGFDTIYPNNVKNCVRDKFKTKENMHNEIESILDKLF